jgi:glucose-6-phosphate dehydrogenase assembly protein OpcA
MEAPVSDNVHTVAEGPGIPVEIGHIDRELGRLWEEAGESKTRASLINLVLYSEQECDVSRNTSLIARIASEHACRAILISACPEAHENRARAWINAHCHLSGKKQICSEQITFRLEGNTTGALPSIVFSHLDSDLPLCLWWQAPIHPQIDPGLWAWVDRLVYDSCEWKNPAESFAIVQKIASGERHTILGDLAWARVLGARFAIAALFDHAMALSHMNDLDRIEIDHAPGRRTSALLLAGWFASRLGWSVKPVIREPFFVTADGRHVSFALREVEGSAISRCLFRAGEFAFCLTRPHDGDFFEVSICGPGHDEHPRVIGAGREDPADLLLAELARGGRHGIYRQALQASRPLIES